DRLIERVLRDLPVRQWLVGIVFVARELPYEGRARRDRRACRRMLIDAGPGGQEHPLADQFYFVLQENPGLPGGAPSQSHVQVIAVESGISNSGSTAQGVIFRKQNSVLEIEVEAIQKKTELTVGLVGHTGGVKSTPV